MVWPDTASLVNAEARSSDLARHRHLVISVVRSALCVSVSPPFSAPLCVS
eukprot:COSAG03_NODE_10243_length_662_cov_2.012433_2_plen_49_part_01